MKKPYYDYIDRHIIKDDNSLFASTARLKMAKHKFCKGLLMELRKIFKI